MQKHLIILIALLSVACNSQEQSSVASLSKEAKPAQRDCLRIVKSEMGNILKEDNPRFQSALDSCEMGAGYYNDEYAACIQESPYSNALDCAYKARGIDRSQKNPALTNAKVGQYGEFRSSSKEMLMAMYRDTDPKRSIDSNTVNSYLDRRDRFREIARLPRIEDNRSPINIVRESFESNGTEYWVVRQTYQELQLVKIMRQDQRGADSVVCAQYGPVDKKLMLNDGLCAGLLKKNFQLTSIGA